jgi:hypothetical protein
MRSIRQPLDGRLKKNNEWNWSTRCKQAFDSNKGKLNSDLLTHCDPSLEVITTADALEHGLGAVIQHRWSDGTVKAIAHASRSLKPAEQNYSQIEKEGLYLIFAVKKFQKYINGRHFALIKIIDLFCRYFETAEESQSNQPIASNAGQQPFLPMILGSSIRIQRILVRLTHCLVLFRRT